MKYSFLLFGLMFFTNHSISQLDKGDRILAYQVDMSENGNYDSAFSYATSACAQSVHLFNSWDYIETDVGVFDPIGLSTLDITNLYYPAYGMPVEMQLAPVNTVAKSVPADLVGVDFDDVVMIDRFKVFLDTFFAHVPNVEFEALNIGNEHDVYFGDDPVQYAAYKVFLDSVIPYAKAKYFALHGENLKVGTTFTHAGLIDPSTSSLCEYVNADLDIVALTYYPLNPDFTMEDPTVVLDDFDELVSIYSDPSQPIYFAECGYSSSSVCGSSEAIQADFYSSVFDAWDEHYDNIKYLTIFKTTDWSQETVDTLAEFYGIPTDEFKEYLRTLGVRTYEGDGTDKIAYDRIKCLLEERNWCSPLNCVGVGLDENPIVTFELYPNPTTSSLHIVLSEFGESSQKSQIEITDLQGKLIQTFDVDDQSTLELDVSNLTKGIYLLGLQNSSGTIQKRFVKQ